MIDPERFVATPLKAPLRLTDLRINGQRQPLPQPPIALELTPERHTVAVQFAALDYADARRFRYAYRLEGIDADWVDSDADVRTATFSRLPPGAYTLRVRAGPRDGPWRTDELRLDVDVQPAWWQRDAFKVLTGLAAALALWGVMQWRTRRLRGQHRALEAAVAARTAELETARAELEDRVEERTKELAAATAAAQTANRAKTAFLQSVSHEMRTPLNAILGLTNLSHADGDLSPAQQQRLGLVTTAAGQLLKLVNDVLDHTHREGSTGWDGPAAAAPHLTPPSTELPLPRFAGQRILLAEDDPVNQLVACGILERAGLVVDVVENGAQAVRQAATARYGLVLMDLQMPELDGLAAARALRATSAGSDLPIIALTAFAFDEDRQRCLEAGMNDHVSKPVRPDELLHAVWRWLRPTSA